MTQPTGIGLAAASRDLELARGDDRRGHVEAERRFRRTAGRGEGDGVEAVDALRAARRHDAVAARSQRDADHVVRQRHQRVGRRRAVVGAVAHRHHAHAGLPGLLDRQLHRQRAGDEAEAAVAVDGRAGGGVAQDAHLGVLVQVTVAGAVDVEVGEAGEAVRLDAAEVGLDEDVDRHAGVVVRDADGGEAAHAEVVELLRVDADVGGVRHGEFL